jgi:Kef-type K+ transport system membrane component KefB
MMDRHRTDLVELLFGLLFVAAGAGVVVHQTTDTSFDAAWIAAIALMTVGVAFLAVTLFNRPRSGAIGAGSGPSSPTCSDNAFVDDDAPVPPPAADPES